MSISNDTFGETVKKARSALGLTQEKLAKRVGVSGRYVMLLENSHKKPSYDLLYKIIRELNIQSDLIFYPEKPSKDYQVEDLIHMLYNCDERSMKVIRATVKALLDSQPKE